MIHTCHRHGCRMVPANTDRGLCCPQCHPELRRKPGRPIVYRVA